MLLPAHLFSESGSSERNGSGKRKREEKAMDVDEVSGSLACAAQLHNAVAGN